MILGVDEAGVELRIDSQSFADAQFIATEFLVTAVGTL